ncbi:CCR4-NOT transcription complex subunit 4-like isoform X2 [Dreissena polymorpha]|uniref:CCR4-NOT transcription complex subunit 4-like isoform X2 n=1 Tax=Dreissena polymorpha TaxID=45954 RepID=UPI0022643103|nr:CCR4-NOT transcription complex subunit 4-like isoform X2 [Dreissena polymorpha]
MSGCDEQIECPLCMEPLEIDDINFFPCTCGYQICRFCWHRIRTDENGLCPACRKAYPEDPAKFNPLTEDELQRIKKERRQKDLQRKQKAAENRKHLANVRVVQRNLVFVVGLSTRLADTEVLKKHEYFGKFGKIHKVVINQSTSYAGAQGPSASAYVTYNKTEDALKAITAVNNVHIDGRTLKASLGTTKYCSHFLRGTQCPKNDCMYLHELGEEAASFTKEEMQVGKHQEYEQKLVEQFMNSQNTAQSQPQNKISSRKKTVSPVQVIQPSGSPPHDESHSPPIQLSTGQTQLIPPNTANREAWPSLQSSGNIGSTGSSKSNQTSTSPVDRSPEKNKTEAKTTSTKSKPTEPFADSRPALTLISSAESIPVTSSPPRLSMKNPEMLLSSLGNKRKNLGLNDGDNLSLFSSINGFHGARNPKPHVQPVVEVATTEIPDSLPVNTTTDWQAAFGFGQTQNNSSTNNKDWLDDDLGFDPLEESSRGLADLLEKESSSKVPPSLTPFSRMPTFMHPHHRSHNSLGHNLPPDVLSSRMMGLMNSPLHTNHYPESMFTDLLHNKEQTQYNTNQQQNDVFNVKDWQDGLRALLPNINISFGSPHNDTRTNSHHNMTQKNNTNWSSTTHRTDQSSWMPYDPAILTSGNISDGNSLQEGHWLKSINHLTDMDSNNHRLPFVQQLPVRNTVWPPQTHNPPPGFQTHIRPPLQTADPHKLAEGLQ